MPKTKPQPSYRLHKARNCAVVTINGKNHYLGPYDSPESHREYARLINELKAAPAPAEPGASDDAALPMNELLAAYWLHAEAYYRTPDGKPTSELSNVRQAMRFVRELYDTVPATSFGPLALKATRRAMIDAGLSRCNINRHVDRVRRIFRWAVENELLPPGAYQALKAVTGLRAGRSDAKETEPVKPVPLAYVEAALPHLSPTLAAAVRVQLLTGCRPGEVLAMRPCDLDTTGDVWIYRPAAHKTAWRGLDRQIYLGPQAQAVIKPLLPLETTAYVFSPRASREAYFAERRANRKTKVQPSQAQRRRMKNPKRAPRDRYSVQSYGCQIRRACTKADAKAHEKHPEIPADQRIIPNWHPHQLRHNRATELKRAYGIEVARIILGHRSPQITEVYAEADNANALRIMAEVG